MNRKAKRLGIIKRFFAWILTAAVALSSVQIPVKAEAWDYEKAEENLELRFYENQKPGIRFYINAAAKYILEDQRKQSAVSGKEYPAVGSTYGEWSVFDLLRGMYTGLDYINEIPDGYFEAYLRRVENYVSEKEGILDRAKSTEWSRLILSLSSLGYDIRNVSGYDFIAKLSESFRFSYRQGINGPIWEMIAMNSGNYCFDETDDPENANTFGKMLDYLVEREITDEDGIRGGWALSGNEPDTDITGMALTALAPYYLDQAKYEETNASLDYDAFAAVTERGILTLSRLQQPNGGYESWGTVNSESTVWAMTALLAFEIDPKTDALTLPHIGKTCSFRTGGAFRDGVYTDNMVDALLTFFAGGSGSSPSIGGFKHVTAGYDGGGGSGTSVNAMATDQALYGLIAYDRFLNGQTGLFQIQDQIDGSYRTARADVYDIIYDAGGEGEDQVVSASPYAEVILARGNQPAQSDLSFVSWNTRADGSGVTYYPGEVLSMPEQDIRLYAQYGRASYSLRFELNGGTLAQDVTLFDSYSPSQEILLPTEEQITKEGCRFDGWYTNEKFTGSKVTLIPKNSYGDKTFYAKWSVISEKANQFYAIVNRLSGHETTITDKADILQARELYDSMLPIEQERITASTLNLFLKKEQELKVLEEGMENAEKVSAYIAALDRELALTDEKLVSEARIAYEALTEEEKKLVENLALLIAAEERIAVLQDNKQKADEVKNEIQAIGQVTLESQAQIEKARAAYQALTTEQQGLVGESLRKILENAENELTKLLEQKSRIDAFLACAFRIPERLSLEDDSLPLVMQAHAAWLKLTDEEKEQVDGGLIQGIYDAEAALRDMALEIMEEEDYQAVSEMEIRISAAGGEVTLDSEENLIAIRTDFDAMSKVQQALVGNYFSLVALEMDLQTLKTDMAAAQAIVDRIAALGEITFESEELLLELRKDYGALNTSQKKLVANYSLLIAAENAMADLKYNKGQADAVAEKIQDIGTVTLKSRDAIARARAAYDALLDKQKIYVGEDFVKILTDAEKEYERLEALVLKSIVLDKEEITLKKGMQTRLTIFYTPEDTISDRTVVWNVADESVATVKDGVVTALGAGETVISAHVGGLATLCRLKVEVPLEKIQLSPEKLSMKKGSTSLLRLSFMPSDTNQDVEIRYTSDRPEIASVDEHGQVTAKAAGVAVVSAICVQNPSLLAQTTVQVTEDGTAAKPSDPAEPVQNIAVSLKKVTFTSARQSGKGKVLLKWKKVKGASGYEIYCSVNNKKKWKQIHKVKKASVVKWTRKKLKNQKKYYFKVRAYRMVNGKKYTGKFSKVRMVKLK